MQEEVEAQDQLEKENSQFVKLPVDLNTDNWTDVVQTNSQYLKKIHNLSWPRVLEFQDIYSMHCLMKTEKFLFKKLQNPIYYKFYVQHIIEKINSKNDQKSTDSLPHTSNFIYSNIFSTLSECYELDKRPILKSQILLDVKDFIWRQTQDEITAKNGNNDQKGYYSKFDNYKSQLFNCPRIRYDGYYVLKDRYFRKGEKDMSDNYSPFLFVEYFRYFRFFDNGLVISNLTPHYIEKKKMIQSLTLVNLDVFMKTNDAEDYDFSEKELSQYAESLTGQTSHKKKFPGRLQLGDYMCVKNKVYVKFYDKTYVNEFELKITEGEEFGLSPQELNSHYLRDLSCNTRFNAEKTGNQRIKYFKFVMSNDMMFGIQDSTHRHMITYK